MDGLMLLPEAVGNGAIPAEQPNDVLVRPFHAAIDTHNVDNRKSENGYRTATAQRSNCVPMGRGNRTKPSELRVAIGRRLRAARKSYEDNGAAFAREVGITPQQLNHYEKGGRFPDEAFLVRFCDLTECPADWILRGRLEARMRPHMAAYIAAKHPELIPNLEIGAGQASASASVLSSAADKRPEIPALGIRILPTRGIRKKAIV